MAESNAGMPKERETVLGLHVAAKEASERWKAEPGTYKLNPDRMVLPRDRSSRASGRSDE
jgi:hypothetical protein